MKLSNFTNLYSLSKTLRFELKPIGKDGKHLSPEDAANLFAKIIEQDRKIKEAYISLKPVMDSIHEQIINASLTSNDAKHINFSPYFEEYKKGKDRDLDDFEKILRKSIGNIFENTANDFANNAGNDEKGKPVFKKKKDKDVGVEYLTQAGIIKYIEKNINNLVPAEQIKEFIERKEIINAKGKKEIEKTGHLEVFSSFFTYFSGYNQNRENYYESDKETSTAVATRIVHENLPKFCDNCILFDSRKYDYLNAKKYLIENNKITQIKNAETGEMIEAEAINEDWFKIERFSECLAQAEIDTYNNKVRGHYNLLINLYNQEAQNEKDFKKLSPFKKLYKQIGCGKKKTLFNALKYDTIQDQANAGEKMDEILNLEKRLQIISEAGKKYFTEQKDNTTIFTFTNWLLQTENWKGIYWSKAAVDKISNQYLANWHDIRDRIQITLQGKDKAQKDALKSVASYDKKREEQLKFNDTVELSGLFEILNQETTDGWSKTFFKESILEDRQSLIDEQLTPSQNLINLICCDIEDSAKEFCRESDEIIKITDYKHEDNILKIKEWLDKTKQVLWRIKYFQVKESKVKGDPINFEITNMLDDLLDAENTKWFDWYDLARNYLTKKPQDDAKKNKLKLNFGYGNLLNGFVDSYSESDNATQYGGYLFRKKVNGKENDFEYFLGISKHTKLFRCHLQDKIHNNDRSEFERLEYYQAKSTTYFDDKYSENKDRLIKAIETSIDEFIKNNTLLKEEAEKIKKRNKDGEITPSALFDKMKKSNNFGTILCDNSILTIVEQTIQDLKINAQKFVTRAPKLQEIQDKEYTGIDGYKQIVEDLQTIAKENKVFNFFNVSKKEFDASFNVDVKHLYLFKISNKDLSYSETSQKDKNGKQKRNFKGIENLHTLFFRALMREFESCDTIDLGKGEIFFRESVQNIKKEPTHKVGGKILNRKEKDTANTIPYEIHNELYLFANKKKGSDELSSEAKDYIDKNNKIDETRVVIKDVKHDITKDKRFTEAKYQLHLSVFLNFNAPKKDVSEIVNENFTQTGDIQFLGIDRGEKHLIYYSLLNAKGKIIDQGHFDEINKTNYLEKINDAAKKRREKQENWQQKGNISNLKDGYISLVVHEIIEKMKDKNGNYKPTFIVLEDLNTGFKRSRQKFEQQVYQKFELALAKKLNYLVDKNANDYGIASVTKALQLTPLITNYQDIENRKQVGIILYTRANYTSVTDPVTGWRKTIYLKKGKEEDIKKQIIAVFSEIGVNDIGDYYFTYNGENTKKEWKLWSGKNGKSLERYHFKRGNNKNEPLVEPFYVKELLDKLFEKFDKSKSLRQQLVNGTELSKVNEHTAWETLRFVIDIIQQIRNSGDTNKKQENKFFDADSSKNQDDNFLFSPVRNELDEHFDSRKSDELPENADANGAYNIARKGIVMYQHIKQWVDNGKKKSNLDLFVSDKEWDLWLLDREKWEQELPLFASKGEMTKDKDSENTDKTRKRK